MRLLVTRRLLLGRSPWPCSSPRPPSGGTSLLDVLVGNTFGGKTKWVLQDVADLYVDPDGTVFTNVPWDEAGGNVQEYRDGRLVRIAMHTHGWGYEGGEAVTANGKYLFIAQTVDNENGGLKGNSWPERGFVWSGVSRRLREDISKGAPFAGGRGREGAVLPGAFLPVVEMPAAGRRGEGKRPPARHPRPGRDGRPALRQQPVRRHGEGVRRRNDAPARAVVGRSAGQDLPRPHGPAPGAAAARGPRRAVAGALFHTRTGSSSRSSGSSWTGRSSRRPSALVSTESCSWPTPDRTSS